MVLDELHRALEIAHSQHSALSEFCAMPADLIPNQVSFADHPARGPFVGQAWDAGVFQDLQKALLDAAPLAQWRYPYAGSKVNDDFSERFGCYCVIGEGGYWNSRQMSGYLVYMPAGLHYPWHHHPAEEMYVILAGEAEFQLQLQDPKMVRAGDAVFHPSGQSHTTTTHGSPLLAYVVWRNELDTPPVWSDESLYS